MVFVSLEFTISSSRNRYTVCATTEWYKFLNVKGFFYPSYVLSKINACSWLHQDLLTGKYLCSLWWMNPRCSFDQVIIIQGVGKLYSLNMLPVQFHNFTARRFLVHILVRPIQCGVWMLSMCLHGLYPGTPGSSTYMFRPICRTIWYDESFLWII